MDVKTSPTQEPQVSGRQAARWSAADPRGFLVWNLVLAGMGTALSILAVLYTRPEGLLFDENYYYPLAEAVSRGAYPDGYIIRPPLYPLFLAAVFKVFGAGFLPAW